MRLAKGLMGEHAAALLGSLMVASFQTGPYARARIPPTQGKPFLLVVDEFASFVTGSFAELLSEARKYGLRLVLAHQHLGQLDDKLRHALAGNTGTRIAFALGVDDALALAPEVAPEVEAYDLVSLAPRGMVVRLAVGPESTRPFSARSPPPQETADAARVAELVRVARERYWRRAAEVDVAIAAAHWLRRPVDGGAGDVPARPARRRYRGA